MFATSASRGRPCIANAQALSPRPSKRCDQRSEHAFAHRPAQAGARCGRARARSRRFQVGTACAGSAYHDGRYVRMRSVEDRDRRDACRVLPVRIRAREMADERAVLVAVLDAAGARAKRTAPARLASPASRTDARRSAGRVAAAIVDGERARNVERHQCRVGGAASSSGSGANSARASSGANV